ncbi:Kazal-type serine protease inhibitor-like protein [Bacteriovorax stolpii]|nr:Kazal-type serine protease inhibitor [Bacteriovorax stolpii]TDP53993.1 Kazal-type serine protease inhibitor-like protein [Bacteriovorax stolpii]
MKRFVTFLRLFSLTTLLVLASCGSDKMQGASTGSNSLTGGQCACNSSYSPVCGYNNVTYDNLCQAKCYYGDEANKFAQGSCNCSDSGPVCGDDNKTYINECEAQAAIRNGFMKRIVKFSDCNR